MHRARLRLWLRIQLFIWGLIYINGQTLLSNKLSSQDPFPTETTENITAVAVSSISDEDLFNSTDYSTLSTTIINPEVCTADLSIGINVINRTSSMFEALITYNCSSIESSDLSIFVNETEVEHCTISNASSSETITVLCEKIWENAGRNWTFTIASKDVFEQVIVNETFTLTLAPLSLHTTTNISITVDADLTSALVYIPNCDQITDLIYLLFRCDNTSDNHSLSDTCEYTCSNLIPGSIYEASLIRLPIPIADDNNAKTFEEETLTEIYRINLDAVTNFTYQADNDTATISFAPVRGNFDEINITCVAQDQHCSSAGTDLSNSTGNCSTCTSISIFPIERGVRYQCQASTIKEDFDDVLSDELHLITPVEPVYSEQSPVELFFNSPQFIVDVVPQSDFESIQSICIADANLSFPCSNFQVNHSNCSTKLIHQGYRGCTYHCAFRTKKFAYEVPSSNNYSIQLFPPIPVIHVTQITSQSISFRWSVTDEVFYIHSYEIYRNRTLVDTKIGNVNFHTEINLLPYRNYTFLVRLISNRNVASNPVMFQTLEQVPKKPDVFDVEKKINPDSNASASTDTQYVVEFDPSLFADDYGLIRNYSFFVRQDQKKTQTSPDVNGNYAAAWLNTSIDYWAFVLLRSSSAIPGSDRRLRLTIGNETSCPNKTSSSIPCNGELKPNSNYSLIVRACNMAGCTVVLSRMFQTKIVENPSKKLPVWAIVLGITIPSLFVVLLVWKRQRVATVCLGKKEDLSGGTPPPIEFELVSRPMRPKLLSQYVAITDEAKKIIDEEYQELEKCHPSCQRSEEDLPLQKFDRYGNIFARGPWKRTAVYLTGKHRYHDYINANFVRGYDYPKEYIACQGPMKNTCVDFWEMISRYHVSKIVMLTNIEQPCQRTRPNCKSDCYLYFPWREGETFSLAGRSVQTVSVDENRELHLQIRVISLQERGTERRIVHYYYTGWPDFGTVEPRQLFDLIGTINNHRESRVREDPSAPIVVHCSAGVGRTGTYIAVDTLVRMLDNLQNDLLTMKLDVMGLVHGLRQDRMRLVQTKQQYRLLNRCVKEYLRRTGQLHLVTKPYACVNIPDQPYINFPCRHPQTVQSFSRAPSHQSIIERDPRSSLSPVMVNPRQDRSRRDSRRPTDASLLADRSHNPSRRNSRRESHRQRSRSPQTDAYF